MTGQTQNTGPARIKSLAAAAIAVVMLGTGLSAGYAIASLGQGDQVAEPVKAMAEVSARTRSQSHGADAVAEAADDQQAAPLRHQAGAATKTVNKDACGGSLAVQASACHHAKVGV